MNLEFPLVQMRNESHGSENWHHAMQHVHPGGLSSDLSNKGDEDCCLGSLQKLTVLVSPRRSPPTLNQAAAKLTPDGWPAKLDQPRVLETWECAPYGAPEALPMATLSRCSHFLIQHSINAPEGLADRMMMTCELRLVICASHRKRKSASRKGKVKV